MKKCAVIIGVNKTGQLPILSAAASGAKDFALWAKSQGFETTLLTDEKKAVTLSSIKKAIAKYVDKKTYSQLIVFFAGHGILKGPNDEQWLLSNAPGDPNEAVNVLTSKYIAYNTGIPYITFISDACRSAPGNPLLTQILGGVIFPNLESTKKQPDIDMFFATKPGDPAYEVKDGKKAAKAYRGLFTSCMLKVLNGEVPEVLTVLKEGNNELSVVYPYELKEYLEKRVPIAAEEIKIDLVQDPRMEIMSRPPKYLSEFNKGVDVQRPATGKALVGGPGSSNTRTFNLLDSKMFNIKRTLNAGGNKKIDLEIDKELVKLQNVKGKESFETQTGFSIIGTLQFEIFFNGKFKILKEGGLKHVRIYPDANNTMLFVGADGTGTPVAVLNGFIGNILVEKNRVVDINYVPSRRNRKFNHYMNRSKEVIQRRAAAALAARHGAFQISGDRYSIISTASYLRNDKALDPTLGLYAAYAYAQAGNNAEIYSVFQYMAKEPEPVIFDVKLLTGLHRKNLAKSQISIAPFCPMLNQGWSYLTINKGMNSPQLLELSKHLIPGLWTTFTAEGVKKAKEVLDGNQSNVVSKSKIKSKAKIK